MPKQSRQGIPFLALVAGAIGIGFAPILVRLSQVGPSATAFYRILFALPVLWTWLSLEQRKPGARQPQSRAELTLLAVAGLFFAADMATWHWSLQFTSVANSTLLANFTPIFVALGARVFLGERISGSFVAGLVLGLGGAALLVSAGLQFKQRHLLGDVLALITATFYAGYLLSVKQLRGKFSPLTIMAWSGVISCPTLLAIALFSGERMVPTSAQGWAVLVTLALVSHVAGQTLIAYGFGHLPAGFSALTLLLQPVVAALLAWTILGEPLGLAQSIGGLIVLAGIGLASQRRHSAGAQTAMSARSLAGTTQKNR